MAVITQQALNFLNLTEANTQKSGQDYTFTIPGRVEGEKINRIKQKDKVSSFKAITLAEKATSAGKSGDEHEVSLLISGLSPFVPTIGAKITSVSSGIVLSIVSVEPVKLQETVIYYKVGAV